MFMFLCEGCSINSFGQTFSKKSEKKLNVLKHCSLNICSFIKNVVLCGYLFKNWASDLSVCTLFYNFFFFSGATVSSLKEVF